MTWDLDTQRSQHLAEMAEVRKSLEQIRVFTQHKDVLAQEIQDENDQLKDQLRRLISLQGWTFLPVHYLQIIQQQDLLLHYEDVF